MRRLAMGVVAVLAATFTISTVQELPAGAVAAVHAVPDAIPASWTPAINNGQVHSTTQVGNTMVIGGTFSNVSQKPGGAAITRNYILAFDATTGTISSFNPQLNGAVEALAPGPTSNTVYVGGAFTQVNGVATNRIALLDLSTGQAVASFNAPLVNGAVNAIDVFGNRLYIAGYFTKVGGKPHGGLGTLNATTGALDPFMTVQLAGHHNDTGSGDQTSVGVRSMDVTTDGARLVAIGNFKTADGVVHDQVVVVNLTGASGVVQTDWNTTRYQPMCFSWAFDSDVRQVRFAPNGNWFVITATGGHNGGTLCDTASRFETYATGSDIQPTWIEDAGGDTLWGLAITDSIVFVGGHQRWLNDSHGSDYAAEGAVPRPGLAALDATNGLPIAWNPGRNPRGAGAYTLYAGTTGLWVGSDTAWIGNQKYKRPRIAFFPWASGYDLPSTTTPGLPGSVFEGGPTGGTSGSVLYRVDAAGPTLASIDGGPDWAADNGASSPYHNSGSNAAGYSHIANVDSTVPSSTPSAIFDSERWSPSDNPPMQWYFPVPTGVQVDVRLYFANRYSGTGQVGQRIFNVDIDGTRVLNHFDIVAAAGDQTGTMRKFSITSDGTVNIDFSHVVENPLVNGIEIVRTDGPPPPPVSGLTATPFDGSTAGSQVNANPGDLDWSKVRGAFMLGSTLYYGYTDGFMYQRSFDGKHYGVASKIDPYDDPTWDGVPNGSGGTYDGAAVDLYGQLNRVTSMFYSTGRLYYTLSGQSGLYYRYFTPDSGILGSDEFTASGGMDWSDTGGAFVENGTLYYSLRSTGALWSVPFVDGVPAGTPVVVNDPATGGQSWSAHALFVGPNPPANQPPVAQASITCPTLTCTFDGSASSDPDGTVVGYDWTFGDTQTGSGAVATHGFAQAGTYQYTLTVTDNDGGQSQTTGAIKVTDPSTSPIAFRASTGATSNLKTPGVTIPSSVQTGDLMLLTADVNSSTVSVGDPTGVTGWTSLGVADANGLRSQTWWKLATAGDSGAKVTVPLGSGIRSAVQLLAYSGTDSAQAIDRSAFAVDTTSKSAHVTPTVHAGSGDWVVSLWADKSSATTQWTAPAAVTQRDAQIGTGTNFVDALAADSGAGVGLAPYGGLTATTNQVGAKGAMWTIALTAAS